MKKLTKILWGIAFIAVGVIIVLNVLGITDIDILFAGWWTVFIIVPALVGLFSNRNISSSVFFLALGVGFLLACQKVITFGMLWRLAVPVLIIIIGVNILINSLFGDKNFKADKKRNINSDQTDTYSAVFCGKDLSFKDIKFTGADFVAVFGGISCDLSQGIIENDCVVEATGVFGKIDIKLPANINVKVNSTSVFGGASGVKRIHIEGAPTVFINSTAVFGGVEIN